MTVVHVLQEDIDRGLTNDSSHCPVAEAIKAEVEGAKYVAVDLATIRVSIDDTRYIYATPASVAEFLVNFDSGSKHLRPFKFRLLKPLKEIDREARRLNRETHTQREAKRKTVQQTNVRGAKSTPKKQRQDGGGGVGTTVQKGGKVNIPLAKGSNLAAAKRVGRARTYGMRNLTIYDQKDM